MVHQHYMDSTTKTPSIETTHVYLQADLTMQERALEKLDPIEGGWKRFRADDPLLTFLASL